VTTLPLTDSETALMPELRPAHYGHLVHTLCEWCGIRLAAIPDAPRQIDPDGPYYHPGGCIAAARGQRRGEETETFGILDE
jgi:hypothetical protein